MYEPSEAEVAAAMEIFFNEKNYIVPVDYSRWSKRMKAALIAAHKVRVMQKEVVYDRGRSTGSDHEIHQPPSEGEPD